jgi:hypothetical protein
MVRGPRAWWVFGPRLRPTAGQQARHFECALPERGQRVLTQSNPGQTPVKPGQTLRACRYADGPSYYTDPLLLSFDAGPVDTPANFSAWTDQELMLMVGEPALEGARGCGICGWRRARGRPRAALKQQPARPEWRSLWCGRGRYQALTALPPLRFAPPHRSAPA